METTEPESQQNLEGGSSDEGDKFHVSHVGPDDLETQDTQWLRMDPSLTRAVLAKTEEELLGGLAALMRSKVEHEQVNRRLAQVHIDNQQARQGLEAVKDQIRRAEQEVATRLNEQARLNEEITRIRAELDALRRDHQGYAELVAVLKNELSQTRQSLDQTQLNLNAAREATENQFVAHREALDRLAQTHHETRALEGRLVNLREEVEERIRAREALIADLLALQDHVGDLTARREALVADSSAIEAHHADLHDKVAGLRLEHSNLLTEIENLQLAATNHGKAGQRLASSLQELQLEVDQRALERESLLQQVSETQAQLTNLLSTKGNLERSIDEAGARHFALQSEIAALESHLRELASAAESAEKARNEEGLPLLFGVETQRVAREWDSYALESEFHTEEELDADKVAELVAILPGLDGCMLVKNHGPVLASQLPERLHSHLKVPNRNYQLLFERLEDKLEEYNLQNARLATYKIGEEALTIAQANHAFLFASHKQARLRPGVANKLASIVVEVAKMYP
jgi:chromosome segregation ATPase